MSRLVTLFFLCFISASINAAVYQYKDDEANITYSDELTEGGKRIKQNKPSVAPKPVQKKIIQQKRIKPKIDKLPQTKKETDKPKPYTELSIIGPKHDMAIRRNDGDVDITLSIKPALQVKFGHKIKIIFDGKKLSNVWSSNSIRLKTLDRGSHTISALLVDKSGKTLKQSKATTFHLLRYSRLLAK